MNTLWDNSFWLWELFVKEVEVVRNCSMVLRWSWSVVLRVLRYHFY